MRDRPIIFSGLMVRALLDGRKTQTRRVLKPPYGTLEYLGGGEWRPICTKFFRGDRLWVREAIDRTSEPGDVFYRADYEAAHGDSGQGLGWRPSIHMPRWASRLTLIVTDVRVQRLQEISDHDGFAEGIDRACLESIHGPGGYRDLWSSLHGQDAWKANPWVVALTFTVHRKNIDQMPPVAASPAPDPDNNDGCCERGGV